MAINYASLTEAYKASPNDAAHGLKESLQEGSTKPGDIELGRLWEELYGHRAYNRVRDNRTEAEATRIMEAGDAVMSGTFANITGQVVYSAVMEQFSAEPTIFSDLVKTVSSTKKSEKIPGMAAVGDQADVVPEGEDYPLVGLGEDWITTPETEKRGMILPITKEAIFFDSTGMLLTMAGQLGTYMALNKEKRVIDAICGTVYGSAASKTYTRKGTSYLNFYADTTGHGVDNLAAAGEAVLADWTDIEHLLKLFAAMVDFNTSEPITVVPKHLIVGTEKLATAHQIIGAMKAPSQGAVGAAAAGVETPKNIVALGLQVVSSPLFSGRKTTGDWFLGDIGKFCWYMQNWPVTVSQAPSNSHDEFHKDIVQQFKVSERGVATVVDPHYMVVSDAA